MNADSYLLLNSVLGDRPCIDESLKPAVQTAPLAIQAVAQQCYYCLYLTSCVKAQLTESTSAYNTLVQYMAVQQQMKNEERLGRTVSQPPARLTWPLRLPPAAPTSSLELRLTIIGGGSVARCLLRRLLKHPSTEVSSSTSVGSPGHARGEASTLLFHPSRITVLTRQPQALAEFAMEGVKCLTLAHGRAPLSSSDAVVLACQPHLLAEIAQELFTPTALHTHAHAGPSSAAPETQKMEKPAKLKDTAVVVSVLAAVPRSKIAASLQYDERLILRTEIEAPARLPGVAALYQTLADDCAAHQVQYMADRDSFLREAVEEAEAHAIAQLAEEMAASVTSPPAGAAGTGSLPAQSSRAAARLPKELALRAALRAATRTTVAARFLPPPRCAVLLDEAPPPDSFLGAVWATLRQAVTGLMRAAAAAEERRGGETKSSGGAKERAAPTAKAAKAGSPPLAHRYRKDARAKHIAAATNADAVEAPLVHLCVALAMLPEHGRQRVISATLHRYGASPSSATRSALVDSDEARSFASDSSGGSDAAADDVACSPDMAPAATEDALGKRVNLPRAYKHQAGVFWKDARQQFCAILSSK